MQHNEGSFSAQDGLKLYYQSWLPDDEPKAILQIVHGLGEHSGRYQDVIDYFVPKGFGIYAADTRGHGRSAGKQGHIPNYKTVMDDISTFLALVKNEQADKKIFIYGHSMGGNFASNFSLRRPQGLSGTILTSSWLKIANEPSALLVFLLKILNVFFPSFTQPSGLDLNCLSRDRAVIEAYENDPLVHDSISARLFVDASNAAAWALEHAAELKLPALLVHGGADCLTSPKGSQLFHERAEGSVFRLYEGLFHELHHEPEKQIVFEFILGWLDEQL